MHRAVADFQIRLMSRRASAHDRCASFYPNTLEVRETGGEMSQKAQAPSSARGFEILNGVRETLTMINAAVEFRDSE